MKVEESFVMKNSIVHPVPVMDKLGRTFKKLRISVTSSCNFHCEYCVPEGKDHPKSLSLPPEKLADIALKINEIAPLASIRITGGEPLLYKGLVSLVSYLKHGGIRHIGMTTNGSLLAGKIHELQKAGLDSINVSLDSLDENISRKLSRSSRFLDILHGIETSLAIGMRVKLNCTVMKDSNESQIIPLLAYAIKNSIPIRYIELMEMGHLKGKMPEKLFLTEDILNTIRMKYNFRPVPRAKGSTADYWEIIDPNSLSSTSHQFGIISNISRPFCSDCDRLRLSSEGNIFGCLSVNHGFNATEANTSTKMGFLLNQALGQKQPIRFTGSELSMRSIGG